MSENSVKRINNFAEFWPYYLGEHKSKVCRAWHYFGTTASLIAIIVLIIFGLWQWFWLVLVAGYGPAWIGHFVFEKNRPATFKYPFWSLLADYKMYLYAITGRLKNELQQANLKNN